MRRLVMLLVYTGFVLSDMCPGVARACWAATPVDGIVQIGAGSYRETAPRLCKPLPARIFKTAELVGPMVTNQWWSSLVWQPYSENMFAHPAFMRCTADGLVVGYPGSRVYGNHAGIFGSADLRQGDLTIGHSRGASFPAANCEGYSDWFVDVVFEGDAGSLRTGFGHGSPFVFGRIAGGDPCVKFVRAPVVWSMSDADATLGITVNGNHYGLFGSSGSRWEVADGRMFTNVDRRGDHFSVAVLPDNRRETLELFARHAHAHVTDTRLEYSIVGDRIQATYHFVCTPREGTELRTVFALYPHQWKYATTDLEAMAYGSVRGLMKVGIGEAFSTAVPMQGVLPRLPSEGIKAREQMVLDLQAAATQAKPDFADTYWEGKYLGKLVSLSGIAEAAGARDEQRVFVEELRRRLETWFKASPTKHQPVFYYNDVWGTFVGSPPSYGTDKSLNDHHFHYGYFIRAAAEVARLDPTWAESWGPMVQMLVRDIASLDRHDSLFPHLRCFDKYAGHSWASGDANFADGNNQESSSESLNAWYALMLWGAVTGDQDLLELGVFLFNTERTAVEEYWLDVAATNFPADYPHVALGMVWGGKGAFGTWFSGDIDCVHGINWLPFTPASLYLGRHPEYVRKNFDIVARNRQGGTDFNKGWGDLVLMFGALNDPEPAISHLAKYPDCSIEGGNSRPFMEHWVGTLSNLGHVDGTTTASCPFATVFTRDGRKTYVVYNFNEEELKVHFSDSMVVRAAPRTLTVERDARLSP